jgi:Flp pilus assembly protein TadD
VAELHKSLRWNDTQPEVHLQIGMLYDISARPEKAGDAYNRALALFDVRLAEGSDNEADDRVNRAVNLILMGRETDGNAALDVLANSYPDHPLIQGLYDRKRASAADRITREFCLNELVVQP